ncbi:hypothetical protein MRB53_014869 [Persea americana]|uniref:Uncharacterized protein n=1 Tax=Persea americana TaxID=3435 RepID=A0ACC2KC10_PERAE|nr:hypothetical protein MRB53_014869 [Persea americana]
MLNYSEQQSHYYQPSTYQNSVYQQATPTHSQQPPTSYQPPVAATSTYSQQSLASYQQPVMADGCYQQQQPPLHQVSQVCDTNKRPRH